MDRKEIRIMSKISKLQEKIQKRKITKDKKKQQGIIESGSRNDKKL